MQSLPLQSVGLGASPLSASSPIGLLGSENGSGATKPSLAIRGHGAGPRISQSVRSTPQPVIMETVHTLHGQAPTRDPLLASPVSSLSYSEPVSPVQRWTGTATGASGATQAGLVPSPPAKNGGGPAPATSTTAAAAAAARAALRASPPPGSPSPGPTPASAVAEANLERHAADTRIARSARLRSQSMRQRPPSGRLLPLFAQTGEAPPDSETQRRLNSPGAGLAISASPARNSRDPHTRPRPASQQSARPTSRGPFAWNLPGDGQGVPPTAEPSTLTPRSPRPPENRRSVTPAGYNIRRQHMMSPTLNQEPSLSGLDRRESPPRLDSVPGRGTPSLRVVEEDVLASRQTPPSSVIVGPLQPDGLVPTIPTEPRNRRSSLTRRFSSPALLEEGEDLPINRRDSKGYAFDMEGLTPVPATPTPEAPSTSPTIQVPEYGAYSMGGGYAGNPKENQDGFLVYEGSSALPFLAAVMDGHGVNGRKVSGFAESTLGVEILESYRQNQALSEALVNGIVSTAAKLRKSTIDARESGTTAVVCARTPDGRQLIVANVGDSRCVLGRCLGGSRYQPIPLSRDHKPSDPGERQRIQRAGGYVEPTRVRGWGFQGPARVWRRRQQEGGLALSRSVGDFHLFEAGVVAEPELQIHAGRQYLGRGPGLWTRSSIARHIAYQHPLTSDVPLGLDRKLEKTLDSQDHFIVLGSDGVFDHLSNAQVILFLAKYQEGADFVITSNSLECHLSSQNSAKIRLKFGEKLNKLFRQTQKHDKCHTLSNEFFEILSLSLSHTRRTAVAVAAGMGINMSSPLSGASTLACRATNSSKLLPTAASPSLARTSFAAGSERSGHQGPRPAAVLAATDPPIADLFDEVSRREDTVSVVATTQQLANTSMVGHDQSMRLETDEAALEGRLPDGRHQLACVTIFGFGLADLDLVMTEFERCGRILRRETKTNCNWLHVQFDDQLSAQRALSKHGMVLSARLMVGVQPCLDEEFLRNAVESRSRTEMGVLSTPVRKTPIRDLSARSRVTAGAGFEPQGQTSGPVPATPQPSSYMKSLRDYVLGW
ncbi:uncharacterized protein MONBRDRAFT_34068 [Monosiga brevicollis MX1]|uniref:PPM-type phosphatase domain-containing protein n=1 Tax=Monosiga brevicollis TaxID=81824 RepID=A9V9A6_MONBE|nr:uncharacterized protein MONBRDRAFT_34068 [Monosiga brevicollis MX1]EDQ85896.1 predicted protein [Monosiga brevicollis MX1]|eukprot:XP_001749375.1 hypothetical protein [Monosiga brevicollis MX1]